jgi:flagellar basal-body rod protein FlgB
MLDQLDNEFAFNRQALDVRAYRQELLSSNIANADTPGYQARDVDFASTLARSLQQAGGSTQSAGNAAPLEMTQPAGVTGGLQMVSTEPGHMTGNVQLIPSGGASDAFGAPAYRMPTQPALDGNTVDLDTERVQFADNALHYETGMTVATQQIKNMISAITSGS